MYKISHSTLFSLFFLLSGCGLYLKKIIKEEDNNRPFIVEQPTYCVPGKTPQGPHLLSQNESSIEQYLLFLEKVKSSQITLNSVEKFVLWSLLQMNYRPDLSTPTARLQILIQLDDGPKFFDFRVNRKLKYFKFLTQELPELPFPVSIPQEETKFQDMKFPPHFVPAPYLFGLDYLLKFFKNPRSLLFLAQILDRYFSTPQVGKELALFFEKNSSSLLAGPQLKNYFFKGDEILKESESLPRLAYTPLIRDYFSTHQNLNSESLYNYNFDLIPFYIKAFPEAKVLCNQDLQPYENTLFFVGPEIIQSHIFGFKGEKQNDPSFLAASSQKISQFIPYQTTFLLQGDSLSSGSIFCATDYPPQKFSLVSTSDRDPGQHLYHLLKNNLLLADSLPQAEQNLKDPRYLFLLAPMRLIYESDRGSSEQLASLLQLSVPLYHATSLGKIWTFAHIPPQESFLIDERHRGFLNCQEKTKRNEF